MGRKEVLTAIPTLPLESLVKGAWWHKEALIMIKPMETPAQMVAIHQAVKDVISGERWQLLVESQMKLNHSQLAPFQSAAVEGEQKYLMSGPVIVMILVDTNKTTSPNYLYNRLTQVMGDDDPFRADGHTIRGRFGESKMRNAIYHTPSFNSFVTSVLALLP